MYNHQISRWRLLGCRILSPLAPRLWTNRKHRSGAFRYWIKSRTCMAALFLIYIWSLATLLPPCSVSDHRSTFLPRPLLLLWSQGGKNWINSSGTEVLAGSLQDVNGCSSCRSIPPTYEKYVIDSVPWDPPVFRRVYRDPDALLMLLLPNLSQSINLGAWYCRFSNYTLTPIEAKSNEDYQGIQLESQWFSGSFRSISHCFWTDRRISINHALAQCFNK